MPTRPILIRNHLQANHDENPLLIVHDDRVYVPEPALLELIGAFSDDGKGGFISPGMAADGRFGYVNGRGEWVVAPTLLDARNPGADGLARFRDHDGWGYLDRDCAVVIPAQYEQAEAFHQGRAAVKIGASWHYIDCSGAFAFDGAFYAAEAFSAVGLAAASPALSAGFGYIDRDGNWAIPPRFLIAYGFGRHGAAPVTLDGKKFGLIDPRGQWIRQATDMSIRPFNSAGLASFYSSNGRGYMDSAGREAIRGSYLANQMHSGMVRDADRRYVSLEGTLQTSHLIDWGNHFTIHGFAVVRGSLAPAAGNGSDVNPVWGTLGTDGRFHPVPASALEPLTDTDGWCVLPEAGTPLTPFITQDGNIVLLDREAAIAYRLDRETHEAGHTVALRDAAGRVLWRSAPAGAAARALPYFDAPGERFLKGMDDCSQLIALVDAMLAHTGQKLQALAAGENVAADVREPDEKDHPDDYDYLDEKDVDDEGDDEDQAARVRTVRRVFRIYLNPDIASAYPFLPDQRSALRAAMKRTMIARLTEAFGPADADPDYAGEAAARGTLAWKIALRQPLPVSGETHAGSGWLWVGITEEEDAGDGDMWEELWLHCAPSIETLEAAMMAAPAPSAGEGDQDDSADEQEDGPPSYADWLARVSQGACEVAGVPQGLLDDAMADTAVQTQANAYNYLPAAFQTPARLETTIRSGAESAACIGCISMTADGLALARSLYAENERWHRHDLECSSRPPSPLNHNSLHNFWGCLIDDALAMEAIQAGAGLGAVPRWLRSEQLVQAALQMDIGDLRYLDSEQITPDIADAAVREPDSALLKYVPEALRTPERCQASVDACGGSLEFVPAENRTVPLCVAAMNNSAAAFLHVPTALEEAVFAILIADAPAGAPWHGLRAWGRLWRDDNEGAIADATRAAGKGQLAVHSHFIMACAYDAADQVFKAGMEAATVLGIWDEYETQFGRDQEAPWLKQLAAAALREADDATLLSALARYPIALSQIPHSRMTADMAKAAIKADRSAVRFVPARLMNSAWYGLAIKDGSKQASQVPAAMWTLPLALTAVRSNAHNLAKVPQALRTLAVCQAAVAQKASVLSEVPAHLRDQLRAP